MRILKANKENIKSAAAEIRNGNLVAFPTETVYGLGADGLNPIAAAKIFKAKNRPSFNPLILHVADHAMLEKIVEIKSDKIDKLIEEFWPGPLTLVIDKTEMVPEIITAGHPTVAVRMPSHPVALELIKEAGTPIAAPSANAFSQLSPTKAEHVVNQLGENVDVILDGGECNVGVESTIIKITEDEVILLRPGGLAVEKIENIVGKVLPKKMDTNSPIAPGMLPFHYSPRIPLKNINSVDLNRIDPNKTACLFFDKNGTGQTFEVEKYLSESGDLTEAAANLFAYLHELEAMEVDLILFEEVEEVGLGKAIMDRLRKASKRYE